MKQPVAVARAAAGMVEYPHVTTDAATCDGQPSVAGTGIRITDLANAYENGTSPASLQEYFEDHGGAGRAPVRRLSLSEVHAALAFYYDNLDAMVAMQAESDRLASAASQLRRAAILKQFLGD